MKSRSARLSVLYSLALAAGPAAAAGPALEEIVVTATRSEMRLLDFAGAIGRVEADEIAALGATHHSELMNRVPGVMIQRGSGQESLTAVRSPVLTGAGSCGAFLFLEDGIPLRPVGFCNVNELFEVNSEQAEAVEVIRGTGSALYGSNAVHGIVNVINPLPTQLPALGLACSRAARTSTARLKPRPRATRAPARQAWRCTRRTTAAGATTPASTSRRSPRASCGRPRRAC
jgi:outer membrane cobalamin receptor